MITQLFKKIIAKSWEFSARKKLKQKFELYGTYKTKYSWEKFERLNEHYELFRPFGYKINPEWYKYFTLVRQEENPAYLPEDIWHLRIEPVLNNRAYNKAFNDKNLFNLTGYKHLFPKSFLHIIDGIFYSPDYLRIEKQEAAKMIPFHSPFVAKIATDSGGGKGVRFYDPITNPATLENILSDLGKNVVIQEVVKQHSWYEKFNKDSINTIRVVTYRSVYDEKVHVLHALLRMGKKGSKVDNQSSGGIAIGINYDGKLNKWGCDKMSNKYYKVNDLVLKDIDPIPDYANLKAICVEIAEKRFFERVLVFDTWRDVENRVRLTEINNINIGIEDLQKNNGPFLGEFTEEIVNYCSSHPRSYCFDYVL